MTKLFRVRGIVCFLVLLLVVSCAASGPPFQLMRDVAPDKGALYIYRPASIVGSGMALRIGVDGRFVGAISNGGYLPLTLEPGIHVVSLMPFDSIFLITPSSTPVDINIDAGHPHYVRTTVAVSNYFTPAAARAAVTFQGVDEQVALKEISSLHLSE